MGERRVRRWRVAAVALLVAAALAACTHGSDGSPAPSSSRPPAPLPTITTSTSAPTPNPSSSSTTASTTAAGVTTVPGAGSARALLDGLAVRTADPAEPYVRDLMDGGDWDYDSATGCNTRELVLIDESLIEPQVDAKCRTTVGRWRSLYDGRVTDDPADLQIDHFVPLADAWRSGASAWPPERRLAFANDRTSPNTLIAVTGSTNTSKGDSTPDQWLPPDRGSWCTYAEMWVEVKVDWGLSVTRPEHDRLAELLTAC